MTDCFYTYNAVFEAPVSGAAKLAYAYLCKCANREGKCWPSHKTLASAAGVCVTTVKKALAELERTGLIAIRGRVRPDRGRRANVYTILKDAAKGFFVTRNRVFMGNLTAKARLVYLYFCRLASGRDEAFPSHRTTARACGLSVSGARAAVDELEAAGLVEREAQYRDNGGRRANLYTLTAEPKGMGGGDDAPQSADGAAERNDEVCRMRTDAAESANEARGDASEGRVASPPISAGLDRTENAGRDEATGPVAPKHPPCRKAAGGTLHMRKYVHNETKGPITAEKEKGISMREAKPRRLCAVRHSGVTAPRELPDIVGFRSKERSLHGRCRTLRRNRHGHARGDADSPARGRREDGSARIFCGLKREDRARHAARPADARIFKGLHDKPAL